MLAPVLHSLKCDVTVGDTVVYEVAVRLEHMATRVRPYGCGSGLCAQPAQGSLIGGARVGVGELLCVCGKPET